MVGGAKVAGGARIQLRTASLGVRCFSALQVSVPFNAGFLDARDFLPWFHAGPFAPTGTNLAMLTEVLQPGATKQFMTGFTEKEDRMLGGLYTKVVQQVPPRLLSVFTTMKKSLALCTCFPPLQR